MRVFTDLTQLPFFRDSVITIGSFDGVHAGHRRILEKVRALATDCRGESVVITFDPHPRTVLHPDQDFKLITTTREKIDLLAQCGIDNVVVVPFSLEFSRQSAREYVEAFLVKSFHPRYIVVGYDHRFGNNREGGLEFLRASAPAGGYEVVEIPAQEIDEIAVSSSKIRVALESADLHMANRLLGYPYLFSGRVVEGNRLGRTIGFPTANLALEDPFKLVLPPGIYAARAKINDRWLGAMLYIGTRPTVEPDGSMVIEVNLLDFEGDLYGQRLEIEVLEFIRPDRTFDGMDALKAAIEQDRIAIREKLASAPDIRPAASEVSGLPLKATIVILNYNTRRHLEQFMPSVVANSPGVRIVVADNGSPDDSLEFLRTHYPQVERIDLRQNYGFAEGYNQALKQIESDVYVILNSDVEVQPGWIEPVLAAFGQNPDIAIAQPKILCWPGKDKFEYAGAAGGWIDALGYPFCRGRIFGFQETDTGQYDDPQECFWAAGAAFFIRAELFHAFGGFDGDYFAHNEEIDLCWRIKRAGYSVWCLPASVVYHLGGGTLGYDSPRKVFLNFRNSLFTLLKNESWSRLLFLLPVRFLLDGVAGLHFMVQGRYKALWAIVRAHFSFYGQVGVTLRKRRAAAETVDRLRIAPEMNRTGIFKGSIVWQHYAMHMNTFAALLSKPAAGRRDKNGHGPSS